MNGWVDTYLGYILQVYGLAFFVLGVVVFVLPRRKTALTFAPHLGWLAAFGMLHRLLEFADNERLHHSAQREVM